MNRSNFARLLSHFFDVRDRKLHALIGLQLATYVDRGLLRLDEPIGNYLPDFDTPRDRNLTFRAGHVHATGIHFPWDLAFSRLFYFHTWNERLIAHCKREWLPGKSDWRSACKSDPLRRVKRTHLGNDLATGSCVVFRHSTV